MVGAPLAVLGAEQVGIEQVAVWLLFQGLHTQLLLALVALAEAITQVQAVTTRLWLVLLPFQP